MIADERAQFLAVRIVLKESQLYHIHIAVIIKSTFRIPYIRHSPAHSCGEIPSGFAQYHNSSAGHIFASVVSHALDYRSYTAVSHAETFTYCTVDIHLAGRCAIAYRISGYDVLFSLKICLR